MIVKPNYSDAPKYCHYYFDLVTENNLLDALQNSYKETLTLIASIPTEKENYSYAERKWTTKDVLRHIIDCERVYAYRAFRFSRFDDTELPGFDENQYIIHSQKIQSDLQSLKDEYSNIRESTLNLFKPMTENMLDFKGTANTAGFTARGLGYMTVGHNIHHCNFIKTHYL
ncbi:MAG: DinB family protein [Chitinophagaceae bacterium]|nr:DinB family protein [Chitinophagaceae bacterium]MBK9532153.1 DinB family protein [Chitinophagaceae bacterium]